MRQRGQRGSVLLLLLGALATLGALTLLASTLLTPLLGGASRTSLMASTGQTLTQAAYTLSTETTENGSGIPVARALLAASPAPTGGGQIPASSAAAKVDAWATAIGYCTNAAAAQGDPVFAVISAGPDKAFQTSCAQALAGIKAGDDGVRMKTVANIKQGVGGTVYFGDPVANLAALEALTVVHAGETRVAKDTGYSYVNKTGTPGAGNWQPSSTQGLATAVDGSGCNYPADTLARNATGSLLSCQQPSGQVATWKRQDACVVYSNGNLNALETDGCFNGANMTNAPTTNWYFVESFRHANLTTYYMLQRATCMDCAGNVPVVWERTQQSATTGIGWGTWQKQMRTYGDTSGKVVRDFACFNTIGANNTSIHIKTNINMGSNGMWRLLFEGYNYGAAQDINAAAGYAWSGQPNIITSSSVVNYASGGLLTQYITSDGYVAMKMTHGVSFYYAGFCISGYFTNPVMPPSPIAVTFVQQAANL